MSIRINVSNLPNKKFDIVLSKTEFFNYFRYDKRRSLAPGRARLPNALPAKLPCGFIRHNVGMLEQGPDEEADFRNPPVEIGRLLHHGRLGIQGSVGLLSNDACRYDNVHSLACLQFV